MSRLIFCLFVSCISFGQITGSFPSVKEKRPRSAISTSAWRQIGSQALGQVRWDWKPALVDWSIQFGPGRPGYNGLAQKNIRRVTIWIRSDDSPESVAGTIVHELAHAFDWEYLTPTLRNEWLAARNLPPDTPWYFPVGKLSSDYLSGAGDFAESVSRTLQGSNVGFCSCLGLRLNEQQKKMTAKGCRGIPPNKIQQALIRTWLAELPRMGGK